MADEENVGTPPAAGGSHEEFHEGEKLHGGGKKSRKRPESAGSAPQAEIDTEHEAENDQEAAAAAKEAAQPQAEVRRKAPPEAKVEAKPMPEAGPGEAKAWTLVGRLRFERRVGKRRR